MNGHAYPDDLAANTGTTVDGMAAVEPVSDSFAGLANESQDPSGLSKDYFARRMAELEEQERAIAAGELPARTVEEEHWEQGPLEAAGAQPGRSLTLFGVVLINGASLATLGLIPWLGPIALGGSAALALLASMVFCWRFVAGR
jgi:hypothetical protein